jgi:pimeloyl-ACP methyl ester carboxylesterase
MWLRRLLLIPILLGFVALGAWFYFFYVPKPDARLACYYGGYDFNGGLMASVTPTSGPRSLRITFMSGETWRLDPAPDATGLPSKFTMSRGWTGEVTPGAAVEFGTCEDGRVRIRGGGDVPDNEGRRQTFDVTDATFVSHGLKLYGRLVMPRVEGAVPVAVLGHGSESDSAVLFNRLQYLLPANGIGVFVFDKRGTGKSEGSYTQNFHWLADDMAAALNKARELAGELGSEVGYQGGSQAGWILPLAAGKAKTDFVLVGFGLAEGVLAEDREEAFDDLRAAGYGDDVIAKAREITDATGQVMLSRFKDGYEGLDAVREKYGKEPWYEKVNGEYTGYLLRLPNWVIQFVGPWLDMGTSWEYDPLPALQAYQGPHLWVLAGRDSSAPSATTLKILRDVQATHPNLDIVMFPNADHGIIEFTEGKDGTRNEIGFSPGYFPLMVEWIHFKQPQVNVAGPIVYDGDKPETAPQ